MYIGEIRYFGFNFTPEGWAACDGSILPIAENNALFALIGNIYGGDGQKTFALPDLRGVGAIHQRAGRETPKRAIGSKGNLFSSTGEENSEPSAGALVLNACICVYGGYWPVRD